MIKITINSEIKVLKLLTSVYKISNFSKLTLIKFDVYKRLPLNFPPMK